MDEKLVIPAFDSSVCNKNWIETQSSCFNITFSCWVGENINPCFPSLILQNLTFRFAFSHWPKGKSAWRRDPTPSSRWQILILNLAVLRDERHEMGHILLVDTLKGSCYLYVMYGPKDAGSTNMWKGWAPGRFFDSMLKVVFQKHSGWVKDFLQLPSGTGAWFLWLATIANGGHRWKVPWSKDVHLCLGDVGNQVWDE